METYENFVHVLTHGNKSSEKNNIFIKAHLGFRMLDKDQGILVVPKVHAVGPPVAEMKILGRISDSSFILINLMPVPRVLTNFRLAFGVLTNQRPVFQEYLLEDRIYYLGY